MLIGEQVMSKNPRVFHNKHGIDTVVPRLCRTWCHAQSLKPSHPEELENVILIHMSAHFRSTTIVSCDFPLTSQKNLQNLSLKKWKEFFVSILHLYAFLASHVLFVLFWKKGGSISFSFVGGKPPQAKGFTGYLNWYPHLNYIKSCKSFYNATWKCMLKAYANIRRAVVFTHLKQNIMALTAGHV